VRLALGASDGTIVREALAESVVLGLTSGGLGALVAAGLTRILVSAGAPLPRTSEIAVGARVLLLGLVVSIVVCAVAGLVPLGRARLRRLSESLASGSRPGVSPGARRLYSGFVVLQVALALTLFVAAGLLSKSFYNLVTVPRGFEGDRILTGYVSLPAARYANDQRVVTFYEQLIARLATVPGVESASGTWALPFSDGFASSAIVAADRPVPDVPPPVSVAPIFPGFFRTLGVPLQRGRDFDAGDGASAPEVAIVNETLARKFWPNGDALGKSIRPADPSDGGPIPIVGIVADMKRRGLELPPEPEVYRPFSQAVYSGDLYVTLRVGGDPKSVIPAFRRVVTDLDRGLPLMLVSTLDELVDASIVAPRFRTMLIGGFAALAGVMALLGVYGVLGFVVAQRKHEIALRGALGATSSRVVWEVVAHGMRITLGGVIVGLAGAAGAAFTVRTMVFGVSTTDPSTYIAAVVGLAIVAGLGSWLPARRAARVDPMLVLRESDAL
jgi:putative ABC transport system permease protein